MNNMPVSDTQARRLIKWVVRKGLTREDAYEALAVLHDAEMLEEEEKEDSEPAK